MVFLRCLLLLLLCMFVPLLAGAQVTNIQFAKQGTNTRLSINVISLERYKIFTLGHPSRLIVDMETKNGTVSPYDIAEARRHGIQNIRYGRPEPHLLRIVFDMQQDVEVKKSALLASDGKTPYSQLAIDISRGAGDITMEEAPITSTGTPVPIPRPKQLSIASTAHKPLIVIDPGHGGKDPGAKSKAGLLEKNLTLSIAQKLKSALEKTGKYNAVLTREKDEYLALTERVQIARKEKGDLFISLHADSHPNPITKGLSVYTVSEKASDKEAAALASQENRSDVIDGLDLQAENKNIQDVLVDLVQRETKNAASQFAERLVTELRNEVRLLQRAHRFAGFRVLKSPDIPSVLVEMGYLTNPHESSLLKNPQYQKKLVTSMVRAINSYYDTSR